MAHMHIISFVAACLYRHTCHVMSTHTVYITTSVYDVLPPVECTVVAYSYSGTPDHMYYQLCVYLLEYRSDLYNVSDISTEKCALGAKQLIYKEAYSRKI